jgi:hypothetical protein
LGPDNTVLFNGYALDGPSVSLHGTNDLLAPVLSGNYSILLQGGSPFVSQQYGAASIFQSGQIPATAKSLIYLEELDVTLLRHLPLPFIQVNFNGQSLSPVAMGIASPWSIDISPYAWQSGNPIVAWGIDISPYAGQSGELRFTVPWLGASILDGIQFSSIPIPEPSALPLGILGLIWLAAFARRANKRLEPAWLALPVYSCGGRRAAQAQC